MFSQVLLFFFFLQHLNAFDIRKIIVPPFLIKSSLDTIASTHLIYTSVMNTIKEEFFDEGIVLYNIDDIHTFGIFESFFLYGFFSYFFMNHFENTKVYKLDNFEKYYKYRRTLRHVMVFTIIVSCKNIENAI